MGLSKGHCAGYCLVAWVALMLAARPAHANYNNQMGYVQLAALLGGNLPSGAGFKVAHVEAPDGNGRYMPNTANSNFAGKTFVNMTNTNSDASSHANDVGQNFYGIDSSIAPGIDHVEVYEANDWLFSGMLNARTSTAPMITDARVANHSWIGGLFSATDELHRGDYVTERGDVIQVAGIANSNISDRLMWKNAFNFIVVGRTDAKHLDTTVLIDSVYAADRVSPHIVTPGYRRASTSVATSWAAPMVGAASVLLLDTAGTAAYSNGSFANDVRTINHAEASETVKALLMAGADRHVLGPHDSVTTDDLTDYRADSTNNLDYDYGAGQMNVLHSHRMLTAGEQDSAEDGGGEVEDIGWDYDRNFGGSDGSNGQATYTFKSRAYFDTRLVASLVWNVQIGDGYQSQVWGDATLANLDLELREADSQAIVDRSDSTIENTEHLLTGLARGTEYELIVQSVGSFNHDYAVAWRTEARHRWAADVDGNWSDSVNFSDGDPSGESVAFHDGISAARTVTLDQSVTVRGLWFDSAFGYTLAPQAAQAITLDSNAGSNAARILMTDDFGSADHVVGATVVLAGDLMVEHWAWNRVSTTGGIDNSGGYEVRKRGQGDWHIDGLQQHGAGARLVVGGRGGVVMHSDAGAGGANLNVQLDRGTIQFAVDQSLASMTLTEGTVATTGAGVVINTAGYTQSTGATLSLRIDGTEAGVNHDQVVVSGHAQLGGTLSLSGAYVPLAWDRVVLMRADSFAGGFDAIENVLIDGTDLAWAVFVDGWEGGLSIVAKATLAGDANLDGAVDFFDQFIVDLFMGWTGMSWLNGDFNGDRMVDAADAALLAANLGKDVDSLGLVGSSPRIDGGGLGIVATPEPGVAVWLLGVAGLALRRRSA